MLHQNYSIKGVLRKMKATERLHIDDKILQRLPFALLFAKSPRMLYNNNPEANAFRIHSEKSKRMKNTYSHDSSCSS